MSIVNRERRKNAGKRMAVLGKKMEEEDDTFWSHETWAEDEDSGNESFHESDEDSALRKDVFDSDFNDSESDNEDEEVAAGEAEERELQKSERSKRRQKNNAHTAYRNLDVDSSNRGKGRRGLAGGMKRAMGEGSNAGIALNLPPESFDSLAYMKSASLQSSTHGIATERASTTQNNLQCQSKSVPLPATKASITQTTQTSETTKVTKTKTATATATSTKTATTTAAAAATTISSPRKLRRSTAADPTTRSSRASSRERRSTQGSRQLRGRGGSAAVAAAAAAATDAAATSGRKPSSASTTSRGLTAAKRKRIAQEELLLEAVHETEPENQRWLYGRKRVQDQNDREKDSNASGLRDRYRGKKIIQKFHSRRGCLITLTFPEMDSVPEILTRRQQPTQQHPNQRAVQGAQQHSQQISQTIPSMSSKELELQEKQNQSKRCVITGKPGVYRDPITKHAYHDIAAFKELRKRYKNGEPIEKERVVVGSCSKSNNGMEGSNKRKAQPNTVQNGVLSRKRIAKDDKSKSVPSIVGSGEIPEMSEGGKRNQHPKTIQSSAININNKLPFQSPKPPSNGKAVRAQHQQKDNLEHLALSFGTKGTFSSVTKNNTQFPLSQSSRRLSPRKWKPSEKVLETMALLPGNDTAIPRGLGMQLKESTSTQLHLDNGNKKPETVPLHNISNPIPPVATQPLVAQKVRPSGDSGGSTINRSHQVTQTVESVVNGDDKVPTNSSLAKVVSISTLTGGIGNSPSNVITAKLEDKSPDGSTTMKVAANDSLNNGTAGQETELNGSNQEANRQII